MAKQGMNRMVFYNGDPTFDAVVGKFRKEAREASERGQSMKAFRVFAAIRIMMKIAGYKLMSEIVIEDVRTGNIFRHGGQE